MIEQVLFQKALDLIRQSRRILVTTHVRPDGDACGSVAALTAFLQAVGKSVHTLLLSPVPQWYRFLVGESIPVLGRDLSVEAFEAGRFFGSDLIILADVNSRAQLPHLCPSVEKAEIPILVMDHHATADHLGWVELVDPTAGATGLIISEFSRYARWPMTPAVAEALFVAIATDTGWFQFGNADSRVYRACADLIDAGANPTQIYEKLYQDFSYARFKLVMAMLDTLELHFNGQFGVQTISREIFEETGTNYEDTENLINECHRIGSVKASALLVELKDGRIRCSLRSRGTVDVSEIARKFGGGGHKMAAGTFMAGPLKAAKQRLVSEFEPYFQGAGASI